MTQQQLIDMPLHVTFAGEIHSSSLMNQLNDFPFQLIIGL